MWFREEFKLRLDTYKRAIVLVYKYLENIESYHIAHLSSGVNEAIYCHLEAKGGTLKEFVGEQYRVEYESTRAKSLEWYFKCKEIEIELREVLGVVEVYFDGELFVLLDRLIAKGADAARTFCSLDELCSAVEEEYIL